MKHSMIFMLSMQFLSDLMRLSGANIKKDCEGYVPLRGQKIACCSPIISYMDEGVEDCKFLCSNIAQCRVLEYNLKNRSCRLLDGRSIGQLKMDVNFNAYYKTECSSPKALKRPEVKTVCAYRLYPRRKLHDKFTAVRLMGPRVSIRQCKINCDAIRRCIAFSFRGALKYSKKPKQCLLARAGANFEDVKDTFTSDLYIKKMCTIDESLATNEPFKMQSSATLLATKMGDYQKFTKGPLQCFRIDLSGNRTSIKCGSLKERKKSKKESSEPMQPVTFGIRKYVNEDDASKRITDVIEIDDLGIDWAAFGFDLA